VASGAGAGFWRAPEGTKPHDIAAGALEQARTRGFDFLILDTAGRLHIDDELMAELEDLKRTVRAHQVILVVDGMIGQESVRVGQTFAERIGVDGVVLSKMDGDARGGAALSLRQVTGKPILFLGVGEKLEGLEVFDAGRLAGRILGMGDVVSLVERAAETIKVEEAEALAKKMAKGQFDLNDLRAQLQQMQRMGGMGMLAGMLPGMKKMQGAIDAAGGDKTLVRLDAIISSMTPKERGRPELMNAKRKIRVANGSGTTVQEVNRLLKMHQEMSTAMKKLRKMGGLGKLGALFGGGGGGLGGLPGGLPAGGGAAPPGLPGLPGGGGAPFNLPPGYDKFIKK
jgi:signal recognition particle subunit SRP54